MNGHGVGSGGSGGDHADWSDDERSVARIPRSRAKPGVRMDPGPDQTVTLSDVAKSIAAGSRDGVVARPDEAYVSYEYEPRPGSGR